MAATVASCGESCGWAAALLSILSFGSFGVPIKSRTCQQLHIDPLVFQSYKSAVCFLTAGLLLPALGVPLQFTPWGLVSGLFWVPGGVACVWAVQLAGLAVAIAVGNSCIALVSFGWGIFVFEEPIQSRAVACMGLAMMVLGFGGMSYYSTRGSTASSSASTTTAGSSSGEEQPQHTNKAQHLLPLTTSPSTAPASQESVELIEEAKRQSAMKLKEDQEHETHASTSTDGLRHRQGMHLNHHSNEMTMSLSPSNATTTNAPQSLHHSNSNLPYRNDDCQEESAPPLYSACGHSSRPFFRYHWVPQAPIDPQPHDALLVIEWDRQQLPLLDSFLPSTSKSHAAAPSTLSTSNALTISRQHVGMALAMFNGCWGGSVLVPMKYCPNKDITNGIGYVWSFSIGAGVVTLMMWVFRFLWIWAGMVTSPPTQPNSKLSLVQAYQALPSMHLSKMWRPGGLSGLLWSIGNVFAILSVDYLGEGVGYCVVQASMLVSGLWGILFFKEVQGTTTIAKWFGSALLTISGILLLSYEHHVAE